MSDFVTAVENASDQDLFVIDLDVLYNMQNDMQQQRRQTMFLSDLLQRLPAHHNYVYLQTVRQGERFLLQQKLVESNCLAYAEKPISNEVLVDKLFNLFGRHKRGETNTSSILARSCRSTHSYLPSTACSYCIRRMHARYMSKSKKCSLTSS
jgi:hypothetical protein